MSIHPLLAEALRTFEEVLTRARATSLEEPTAAVLATADELGRPSARVVLVRGFDERGFVFFTNSHSRKGHELAANPRAALCFHWDPLHEQVRIEGAVETTSDSEADAYWMTRPRESQVGAWASLQSQRLPSRDDLAQSVARWDEKFSDQEVPRPPYWIGYRVIPTKVEFWKGLPARLHSRQVYERDQGEWRSYMLYP